MKFLKYILVVGILCFTQSIWAQEVEFKSSNFKDDKEGFKKAEENIKKGEEYLELGNQAVVEVNDTKDYFERALYHFKLANEFNSNSSLLNYYLGNASLYTNNKYESRAYLEKSLKLNPDPDPMFYYYYAQVLQLDQEFSKAIQNIEKFQDEAKSKRAEELKKFLSKFKSECKNAPAIINNPLRAWVDNIEIVNSDREEYSPCITADGEMLIFTSTMKNSHSPNDVGIYDGDIYQSTFQNGAWQKPVNVGQPLSTEATEVASGLSYDGQRMLLFSMKEGNANVLESKLEGRDWGAPTVKMSSNNNTEANETYASYEPADIKVFLCL